MNHGWFINDDMYVFKVKYYSKHSQVIFQEKIKPVESRNKLYQDHIQNENQTEKEMMTGKKNYNGKGIGSEIMYYTR